MTVEQDASGPVEVRTFASKLAEDPVTVEGLSPDAQAGLRQFSIERMMGYGIDYADAVELRARIVAGEAWEAAAAALADRAIAGAEREAPAALAASQASLYWRASALLRMSQALMMADSDERRAIVRRASEIFGRAAAIEGTRRPVLIDTAGAPLAAWHHAARGVPVGTAIVIGGVEGWAMDFDCLGAALAARGINALMLDGPGQGESRLLHRHFLDDEWLEHFRAAIDFAEADAPALPIGIVGNSMGGSLALAVANQDSRIRACCNNGGIIKPILGRMAGATFFAKMVAFCGDLGEEDAAAVWDLVRPVEPGPNRSYSLLTVQGGMDPLVSVDHGKMLHAQVPVSDKRMEIFSDGDHCIYNHRADRDILIADWMHGQLSAAAPQ